MEPDFWHARWEAGQIGFHRPDTHHFLRKYWSRTGVPSGSEVCVPLCGKSLDMRWLAAQGFRVTGIEVSPIAVEAFFREHGLAPERTPAGRFGQFRAGAIRLLCGDFFDLSPGDLAGVRAVYDRAALVAFPASMRAGYVRHLLDCLPGPVPLLLVTLDYPAHEMAGPPFPVPDAEVRRLFGTGHRVELLEEADALAAEPHFRDKGLSALAERVYLITPAAHA